MKKGFERRISQSLFVATIGMNLRKEAQITLSELLVTPIAFAIAIFLLAAGSSSSGEGRQTCAE
jgi:hypothetical protein